MATNKNDKLMYAVLLLAIVAGLATTLIGMAPFARWPFTRPVHAFSAPVAYLFRPSIGYRSQATARPGEPAGSRPQRRGW